MVGGSSEDTIPVLHEKPAEAAQLLRLRSVDLQSSGELFVCHPVFSEKFAYLGGFSGNCSGFSGSTFDIKTICGGAFADPATFNSKVKLLYLSTGSVEGPRVKQFSEALTQAGIKNVYFESPDTAHEWLTWRRALADFAPRLFR